MKPNKDILEENCESCFIQSILDDLDEKFPTKTMLVDVFNEATGSKLKIPSPETATEIIINFEYDQKRKTVRQFIVDSFYKLEKRIKMKKMKIEMCNDYSALLSERINFDDGYDAAVDEIIDIIKKI